MRDARTHQARLRAQINPNHPGVRLPETVFPTKLILRGTTWPLSHAREVANSTELVVE